MQTISSLYRVEHCRYHTTVVYTNNPYSGAFRGYGNLQATFAVESHMDKLAEAVGMNPLEFRLRNGQEAGETTGQGLRFQTCGLKDCLSTAAAKSDFVVKHARYGSDQEGPVKRGIGVASLLHVGGGAKIYHTDGCGTMLKVDDYAKVTVITGASEIGQGSETVIAQFVAEELGLPIGLVTVINDDSEIRPWDVGAHASRTTFIAGNSAQRAARKARQKLLGAAARRLDVNPEALGLRDGHVVRTDTGERMLELGKLIRALHFGEKSDIVMTSEYYEPPSVMQDEGFKGNVSATYAFGTQVAEVEVDTETGLVRVIKVTAVHDIGRVINALGVEGQIEGGVVMGIGYATRENLIVDEGHVRNPCFRDYKLITAPEAPEIDFEFIETMDPEGPAGAKGIGEAPAICISPAIVNALYNATGVRFYELPLTPENVLRTLKDRAGEAE
jgi:xanthine dehydrogenase molybdenum-binding subunit